MLAQAAQKERSHRKILEFASRIIRERGARASSVEDVMAAAGLTRGGFYAHFRDKTALVAECIDISFSQAKENLLLGDDKSERGRAWLGGEIARSGHELRDAFNRNVESMLSDIEGRLATSSGPARKRAVATLALWTGGMMLARSVSNPVLADEILETCRTEILGTKHRR